MSDFTDSEILDGISRAIAARDMPAVASLLRILAVQAPDKARQIYNAVAAQQIYDAVVVYGRATIEVPFTFPFGEPGEPT